MFMAPDGWKGLFRNTLQQVRAGDTAVSAAGRCRAAHAARQVPPGAVRAGSRARSTPGRPWVLVRTTARSRGTRYASRWCCSRTTGPCCPYARPHTCWLPAPARTISASSAADGPCPGRGLPITTKIFRAPTRSTTGSQRRSRQAAARRTQCRRPLHAASRTWPSSSLASRRTRRAPGTVRHSTTRTAPLPRSICCGSCTRRTCRSCRCS